MSLLAPLIWSVVPSQLAHALLPSLSARLPALFPPAPRGSPAYALAHRRALTALVLAWLAWGLFGGGLGGLGGLAGGAGGAGGAGRAEDDGEDWYAALGVGWRAGDDELRRAWRGLSRAHHPDRAGSRGEARFIALRGAYEALSDPVRRYAYDRFGPGIADVKAAGVREYVVAGLVRSLGFYIASGGIMLALTVVGKARHGAYWRYTLFALLAVLELALLVSPTPAAPARWRPDTPPFLSVRALHRAWTHASIGIAQLAGVWADPAPGAEAERSVKALATQVQAEAVAALSDELAGVVGEPPSLEGVLRGQVEQVFVDRALYSHPLVLPAFRAAATRAAARAHAPTQLAMAASIPLPPSPPASPRPRAVDLP